LSETRPRGAKLPALREEKKMIKEKPGRPERPEVLGLAGGDLSGVVRKLACAGYGGVPPIVIMEDGDSPPRLGARKKVNYRTKRESASARST
jgi:hypothetical protein